MSRKTIYILLGVGAVGVILYLVMRQSTTIIGSTRSTPNGEALGVSIVKGSADVLNNLIDHIGEWSKSNEGGDKEDTGIGSA